MLDMDMSVTELVPGLPQTKNKYISKQFSRELQQWSSLSV